MKARQIIVDENDREIGAKFREEITPGEIYRVAAAWIENSAGEILLSQRSFMKKNDPGKWDSGVVGTVDEGETYDENIRKEIAEEIGIDPPPLEKREKVRYHGKNNFFCQWFFARIDRPAEDFRIQKEEVEQVRWWTRAEIAENLAKNPEIFTSSFPKDFAIFG